MRLYVWLHVLRRELALPSPVTPLARLPLYLRQPPRLLWRAFEPNKEPVRCDIQPYVAAAKGEIQSLTSLTKLSKITAFDPLVF